MPLSTVDGFVSQDFWSFCLLKLEQELPSQQFKTWIKPMLAEDGDGDPPGLRLVVPNQFFLNFVRDRYLPRIAELGTEFFGSQRSFELMARAGAVRTAAPPALPAPSTSRPM